MLGGGKLYSANFVKLKSNLTLVLSLKCEMHLVETTAWGCIASFTYGDLLDMILKGSHCK